LLDVGVVVARLTDVAAVFVLADNADAPLEELADAAPGFPEVGVVAAGVDAGNVVIGVGSGGSGLESTLAIISFSPASD
jgi:hypothetical protein